MNRALETTYSEAQQVLPDGEQSRLADIMKSYIDQFRYAPQHDEALKDPAYRAYVESALDEAEADRLAGRVRPLGEAMDDILGKFKAKHGL